MSIGERVSYFRVTKVIRGKEEDITHNFDLTIRHPTREHAFAYVASKLSPGLVEVQTIRVTEIEVKNART